MADDTTDLKLNIVTDADLKGFQQTSAAAKQLTDTTTASSDATAKNTDANQTAAESLKKSSAATEELNIKKRELLESVHNLTREYPVLGEVIRSIFSPLTLVLGGVIEATEIWGEKMKIAQDMLGGFELPDFTVHSAGVSAAASAYDQLATAVAGANTEFNGAADAFDRQEKAISAQLAAVKQLIDAQKQNAIAGLNVQRAEGKIGDAEYNVRKDIIEKGTSDATTKAEIDARSAGLAAKQKEASGLQQQAQDEANKAANIQPGLNDAALKELIKKASDAAAALGQKATAAGDEATKADEIAGHRGGGLPGSVAELPGRFAGDIAFVAEYGTADPTKIAEQQRQAQKAAEDEQSQFQEKADKLQKQYDDRQKHNSEATRLAGVAEKKRLELQGENDPNKVGSVAWQNAQDQAAQNQRSNAASQNRFAGDITDFNKDAAKFNQDFQKGNIADARKVLNDMFAAIQDAAALITEISQHGGTVADMRQQLAQLVTTVNQLQQKVSAMPQHGY